MVRACCTLFSCIAVIAAGEEGLTQRFASPHPKICSVTEVFQHINYVQNQNNTFIIKLVIMPYIMELVFVSRNTLGN